MPSATFLPMKDARDARISELEQALWIAREAIIHLAPDEYRDLLQSFHSCETMSETFSWSDSVAEKIVEQVKPIANPNRPDVFSARACCPLCRDGAQNFNEQGFKLPEGLRRHLVGYGGIRQCVVLEAATSLARNRWHSKFSESEAKEATLKNLATQARRKTETLFVVGPTEDALLADEGLYFRKARPAQGDFSLHWAEQRLYGLGFQIGNDGNRRSYTKLVKTPEGDFVVFADPRQIGEIHFRVFDVVVRNGKKAGLTLHTFGIRDSWKNNLDAKVAAGVQTATTSTRR